MENTSYWQYNFQLSETTDKDLLITLLSDYAFEGFVETETGFIAYIPIDKVMDEDLWLNELNKYDEKLLFSKELIAPKNWNEEWEKNYESVQINEQCEIYAPFHSVNPAIAYPIFIEPKMSFGTGHHSTTWMMANLLFKYQQELKNKTILDVGCGTGILGIIAQKLGAYKIIAIDNDPVCIENTRENFQKNFLNTLQNENTIELGNIQQITTKYPEFKCDVILANIQKDVIVNDLPIYKQILRSNGFLFVSGILNAYEHEIIQNALPLKHLETMHDKEWIALVFTK